MVLAFSPVLSDPALADYLAAAWPRAARPASRGFLWISTTTRSAAPTWRGLQPHALPAVPRGG